MRIKVNEDGIEYEITDEKEQLRNDGIGGAFLWPLKGLGKLALCVLFVALIGFFPVGTILALVLAMIWKEI